MKLSQLIKIFETLTPNSITSLCEVYAQNACFRDPFNNVQGLPAIERIFHHMFQQVETPRFIVLEQIVDSSTTPRSAFLVWNFLFSRNGQTISIHGGSHLKFDAEGKVFEHRDYWDTAEELYAHLPLIGSLVRFLRRQLSAVR